MPEPLDYAAPEQRQQNRGAVLLGALVGLFISIAALSAALPRIPGYLTPAKILFPLPLLLGFSTGNFNVAVLAFGLASVQYVVYGVVCGFGFMHGRPLRVFLAVTAFHVVCIALCMSLIDR